MTDIDDDLIPDLAFRTLREWLASPKFKTRAATADVQKATDLGRKVQTLHGREWQEAKDIWVQVRNYWRSKGWVTIEENTLGPRSFGTDDPNLEKIAMRMERRGRRRDGRPYSGTTERWIGAITGTSGKKRFQWVTLNYAPLVEILAAEFGPQVDGQTREELAEILSLPPKLTRLIVLTLVGRGTHKEFRPRMEDGTRPKQIVKVTGPPETATSSSPQ